MSLASYILAPGHSFLANRFCKGWYYLVLEPTFMSPDWVLIHHCYSIHQPATTQLIVFSFLTQPISNLFRLMQFHCCDSEKLKNSQMLSLESLIDPDLAMTSLVNWIWVNVFSQLINATGLFCSIHLTGVLKPNLNWVDPLQPPSLSSS